MHRQNGLGKSLIRAVVEKTGVDEHWLRTGDDVSRAEEIINWLHSNPGDKERVRSWLMGDTQSW